MTQHLYAAEAGETVEMRRIGWLHVGRSCVGRTLFAFSSFHNGWSKVEDVESFDNVFRGLKDLPLSN